MLEEAHYTLHTLEENHWWYIGARAVYRTLLEIGLGKAQGNLRMLEVGCGSGGNLEFLSEYGPTVGVEISTIALNLNIHRPALGLIQADATALPFVSQSFDGIHLLGLIEHLNDDLLALREAARVCKSDGVVTLLTSALPFLWSHHDEANLHKRRYLMQPLRDLLLQSGLSPIRISYQNFFTFLPTLIIRLVQRRYSKAPRYDMGRPPRLLNHFLIWLLRLEAWMLRYILFPIGVDLVAVCHPRERGL